MDKGRFEAYTDAIIAIVVTLLVLEIPRPEGYTFSALVANWRSYIVYIITFLQLMGVWYNHHNLLKYVKRVDHTAYWANAVWLLLLSMSPFAMSWVSTYPEHWQPEVFYAIVWMLWSLAYTNLENVLLRLNPEVKAKVWYKNRFNLLMGVTIFIAWITPILGIAVIGVLTIWLVVSPLVYEIPDKEEK